LFHNGGFEELEKSWKRAGKEPEKSLKRAGKELEKSRS